MDNKFYEDQKDKNQEKAQYDQTMSKLASIEKTVVNSFTLLMRYLDGKTTKTEVINQLKSVGTPDALKVVQAVKELERTTKANKLDTSDLKAVLSEAVIELKKIPKDHAEAPEQRESVSIANISEINTKLDTVAIKLEKAISKIKLVAEAPNVEVKVPESKAPIVNVDAPDLKPLQALLGDLLTSFKTIKIPEVPTTDLSKLEKAAEKHTKQLQALIEKPVGGGGGGGGNGTPYVDSEGIAKNVVLNPDGSIPVTATLGTTNYTTRIAEDSGDSNLTYIGKAAIGSATSSAVWQIQKIDETTGMVITWGGTGAFDQVWNNRVAGVYS